jgi:hypothetical protein
LDLVWGRLVSPVTVEGDGGTELVVEIVGVNDVDGEARMYVNVATGMPSKPLAVDRIVLFFGITDSAGVDAGVDVGAGAIEELGVSGVGTGLGVGVDIS